MPTVDKPQPVSAVEIDAKAQTAANAKGPKQDSIDQTDTRTLDTPASGEGATDNAAVLRAELEAAQANRPIDARTVPTPYPVSDIDL